MDGDKYDATNADELYVLLNKAQGGYDEIRAIQVTSNALLSTQQEVIDRLEFGLYLAFTKAYSMTGWEDERTSGHSDHIAMQVLTTLGVERLIALLLERLRDDDASPTEALKKLYQYLKQGKMRGTREELEYTIAKKLQAAGWKLSDDGKSFVQFDSEDE